MHEITSSHQSEIPRILVEMAALAGVHFNGTSPWDIRVSDKAMFKRLLEKGSLGFGESYMDGQWDCRQLDELFTRLLNANLDKQLMRMHPLRLLFNILRNSLLNLQSGKRAFDVGEKHYDIGNDVFEAMLDPTMSYSCGYWADADDLDQAQLAKLDLICRKLQLREGEQVLDVGCGWGGFAEYACKHHGVEVTGITVSREQQGLARERCKGLPVRIELMDYRNIRGEYDKIVSIGMFEHVGAKNYVTYFNTLRSALKDEGIFLLHTIGSCSTEKSLDPWIDKYIFPNGKLPSAKEIASAVENCLQIEDWHNFGLDYARTLMCWWENFDKAWPDLRHRYDERFYRMWKYYLHSCAGLFRSRQGLLWQIVLTHRERQQLYRSIR